MKIKFKNLLKTAQIFHTWINLYIYISIIYSNTSELRRTRKLWKLYNISFYIDDINNLNFGIGKSAAISINNYINEKKKLVIRR